MYKLEIRSTYRINQWGGLYELTCSELPGWKWHFGPDDYDQYMDDLQDGLYRYLEYHVNGHGDDKENCERILTHLNDPCDLKYDLIKIRDD